MRGRVVDRIVEGMSPTGPQELLLVRHGQSLGNVASMVADQQGLHRLDVGLRDADVLLSETGEDQAAALGRWLGGLPASEAPQAVWSSPYVRAQDTARRAIDVSGLELTITLDERLRDRDMGILDLLSASGIRAQFPSEAERRAWHGKFYYRPPGGESWTDVALRVRSFLADLDRTPGMPERLLIACHDAVIMVFRYVCEGLTEHEVLDLARTHTVTNASVTRLRRSAGSPGHLAGTWTADLASSDAHLAAAGVPPTRQAGSSDV